MFHRILLLSTLFVATLSSVNAQNAITDKAEKLFELHAYRTSAAEYEKINASNPLSAKDALLWAQSLTKINDNDKALSIYKFLNSNNKLTDSAKESYFEALLFQGNYSTAQQVASSVQNGTISAYLKFRLDWILNNKNNTKVVVKNLALNSTGSEFGVTPFKNTLVWSSDRNDIARSKSMGSKKDWTGSSNNQMFSASKTNNIIGNIQFFLSDLKNVYNEGFPSFTADGKMVAFMRSNINDGKRLLSNSGIEMSIYLADVDDNGNWINNRTFSFNAGATGFPSLSPDGKSLYFVSDRSGGFGGFDIYKSMRVGNGWSEPRNLGEGINTSGDEITPSSDRENFYFASTQHTGFGGFDIFKAPLANLSNVENIGLGINSSQDDYGYISNGARNEAYFVSNRTGGKGREDIYSLQGSGVRNQESGSVNKISSLPISNNDQSSKKDIPESYSVASVKSKKIFEGILVNKDTEQKLDGVKVTLIDNISGKKAENTTDTSGVYGAYLKNTGDYTFVFSKDGFTSKKLTVKGITLKDGKLPVIQLTSNIKTATAPINEITQVPTKSEVASPLELKNNGSKSVNSLAIKSPEAQPTQSKEKYYAVQLASSKEKFIGYEKMGEDLFVHEYFTEEEGTYKVRLGVFNSKRKADSLLKISRTRFSRAFVVEEKNDSVIKKHLKTQSIPKSYSMAVVKKDSLKDGLNNPKIRPKDNPKPLPIVVKLAVDSTYKIQLGAYKNAASFNDDKVSGIWKIESKKEGALTIFYMDGIKKRTNALAIKKRVQDAGFKDAKVVITEGEKWKVVD